MRRSSNNPKTLLSGILRGRIKKRGQFEIVSPRAMHEVKRGILKRLAQRLREEGCL